MTSIDGLITTNNSENFHHVASYNQICKDYESEKQRWITDLKEQGFKAAHPNDGWVDRETLKVEFSYPHFDNSPQVGDKIMLGWHSEKNNRAVVVIEVEDYQGVISKRRFYHFKDFQE